MMNTEELMNVNPSKAFCRSDERGISMIEMLIVAALIVIITIFAFMQIARAQRAQRLDDTTRMLTTHMEKARLDAIRRHAGAGVPMPSVTINNAGSYTVTMDFDGDGTLEARTIALPQNNGVTFNATFPTTIRYNWRGRTVDAAGNIVTPAPFSIQDANYGSRAIGMTSSGDTSLNGNLSVTPVTVTPVLSNSNMDSRTRVP